MTGRVHPLANARNDAGAVENNFPLSFMTLLFQLTPAQQAALDQLLQDQQNPASPSFHRWLTPEQYADRFGVSAGDAAQIAAWLEHKGFQVDPVSRSRTFITFGGTAGQVRAAFGTAIHRYRVAGQLHYANATDPAIPAALASIVAGIRGMNNFRPKPPIARPKPEWTAPGLVPYAVAPDDFATIYDIAPLYAAGTNGTGQSIGIVGESQLYHAGSDITAFWNTFGIGTATLQQTLVNPRANPGIVPDWVDEANLDIEWSSAVARNATIVFVYSQNIWDSAQYIVDQHIAPVLSMSWAECEMYDFVDLPANRQIVQQANAEGITWVAATGDSGAAGCDYSGGLDEGGLAVNEPASIPEVVAVGGTSLSISPHYWNNGNTSTFESAKGYVPETVWNDTPLFQSPAGGGGGVSQYFPQPSWQTAGGVPNDGWRHLPDVSFDASPYAVPYYVYCSSAVCGSYNNIEYLGGTSASAPVMAGVVGLLNQYLGAQGLGNINPTLYRLAQAAPGAFHDIRTGDNIVPCAAGAPGCVNGEEGFAAGPGYDSATGLGSLDVANLAQNWSSQALTSPLVVASTDQNPVFQGAQETCGTSSSQWNFRLTLAEEAGFATTLTGFTINGVDESSQIAATFPTAAIGARQSIFGCYSLSSLSVPTNVTFQFSGPGWSTTLSVAFQGTQIPVTAAGASNAASGQVAFAPGMIMSLYGTALGTLPQAAVTIPLPDYMAGFEATICPVSCLTARVGYQVPLYYVGPNQVNLQIPYEFTGPADLIFGNPYQNSEYTFTIQATAPGIFTFEDGSNDVNPSRTASVGQIATLFVTGEGKVTPSVPDGVSPGVAGITATPQPVGAVTVTVGGVTASTTFVGLPDWSVGVTQINFTIPAGVPAGRQPVIVTVDTVPSPPAYITIQ